MGDVSKHVKVGQGITAEFVTGTFIIFRCHSDPDVIPGELEWGFLTQEISLDFYEAQLFIGRKMTLSERKRAQKFLSRIYKSGERDRFRKDREPRKVLIK